MIFNKGIKPRPLNMERRVSSTNGAIKLNMQIQKTKVGPLAYKLDQSPKLKS